MKKNNLANRPEHSDQLATLQTRLNEWMQATDDPLLQGSLLDQLTPEQTSTK